MDEFITGTDWEGSSGPFVNIMVALGDLWPEGLNSESNGTGDKDILADGDHPLLAIGGQTAADGRQIGQLCGVVVSYQSAASLVIVNIAKGFISRQHVANVLTYNGGNPATFETAPVIGQPVYVDDSDSLNSGVTLSMSPLNDDGVVNPLAGWLFYEQDEYLDSGVGGPNASASWPKTVANSLVEAEYMVLLK